eukprot:CAMPEP_0169300210 /NCGR_PEP_ID=MMETSP1016-20121227/67490_1 /TAXON_ID=342587 /ORGANISM="Karlodinium micrum, Strain CCMP2283" /LENGTH=162 /DNA_ID=CAMNT_0009392529 /DNA_START=526 /DNA_END=1014 /DNA_ORIENTATION=+
MREFAAKSSHEPQHSAQPQYSEGGAPFFTRVGGRCVGRELFSNHSFYCQTPCRSCNILLDLGNVAFNVRSDLTLATTLPMQPIIAAERLAASKYATTETPSSLILTPRHAVRASSNTLALRQSTVGACSDKFLVSSRKKDSSEMTEILLLLGDRGSTDLGIL